MKLAPAIRLYGLGIILLLALTVCSRNFGDRGGPYFMRAFGERLDNIVELFSAP